MGSSYTIRITFDLGCSSSTDKRPPDVQKVMKLLNTLFHINTMQLLLLLCVFLKRETVVIYLV